MQNIWDLSKPSGMVILGASTGGPATLIRILSKLSEDFPLPIVIVQHMMAEFTKSLANRLDESVPLQVMEAYAGQMPEPGLVLVAPGGQHLFFDHNGRIRLGFQPPRNGVRPSVDVTLESAAERFKRDVFVAILTGMGRDGTEGAVAVKENGGVVLAQDERTCAIFGMPKAVIDSGVCDRVLADESIPFYLEGIVRRRLRERNEGGHA